MASKFCLKYAFKPKNTFADNKDHILVEIEW